MHKAVFAWWNDNAGKGLNVELTVGLGLAGDADR